MEILSCFVCRKRSKWFYQNFLLVRTKHSERTILAIIKIVLGEASTSHCFSPATMCFKCVDRINEYDEVYEKLQIMERELKSMICVDMIPKLAVADDCPEEKNTLIDDVITDVNGVDDKEEEADEKVGNIVLVSLDGPINIEPPQIEQEESIVEEKPVDEPIAEKLPCKKKKSEFHCEECKKSFQKKQGLMVRWQSHHTFFF